jgi:hypothetical protein
MLITGKLLRLVGTMLVITFLVALLAIGWLLLPVLQEPNILERKGVLREAREAGEWRIPGGRLVEVSLVSSTGIEVDLALILPDEAPPRQPLVLILAGQETGLAAAKLIPDTGGAAVAVLGYPFGTIPHRDGLALTLALGRIQRGILDTPPAVLLALDYLLSHPELDPVRVELAGISFGAFLTAAPAVLDERIDRLWLIHGAGDPADVIDAILRERIVFYPLRKAVAWLLATVASAHHLSSEHWVARMTPRPVIVVNASQDTVLTPHAISVLHDALRPPFKILWTPGDHVHPKRPESVHRIVDLMFQHTVADGKETISSAP